MHQSVDLVRQENSGQDTINRAIPKFPQSSEDNDESSIDEEMEERIQKTEELHQLLKGKARRLGRRKVPQRPNLKISFFFMINPSSASMQSQFTNDKPVTDFQNRNRASSKTSRRCFTIHNREMLLDTGNIVTRRHSIIGRIIQGGKRINLIYATV